MIGLTTLFFLDIVLFVLLGHTLLLNMNETVSLEDVFFWFSCSSSRCEFELNLDSCGNLVK